jgi:hypothetical protein
MANNILSGGKPCYQITYQDLMDYANLFAKPCFKDDPEVEVHIKNRQELLAQIVRILHWDEFSNGDMSESLLWKIVFIDYTYSLERENDFTGVYWIFNTPHCHFEQFLVQRYGVEVYEKYATIYPGKKKEPLLMIEN